MKPNTSDEDGNGNRKRHHSEGSFLDSTTSICQERTQSKSRFGSGGNISILSSSHSSNQKQPSRHDINYQQHNRNHVKCTRNDSLRTQVSIQLLDEKMNMIDYLRSHLYHCRDLEKALNDLRAQLEGITSFRKELVDLRTKKMVNNDEFEMGTLSNKEGTQTEDILHNVIVEQSNLEGKQQHLEEKLKEASIQHDKMTEMLIDRLDRFSRDEMGHQQHFDGSICNTISDKTLKSESLHSLTMFGRIQKLSEFLANETKVLKDTLQTSESIIPVENSKHSESPEGTKTAKVIDIPPELFTICKDLREELVVLMEMQNLEAKLESKQDKGKNEKIEGGERDKLISVIERQRHKRTTRFREKQRKKLPGRKNITSFSESDLRYYARNQLSKHTMDTDESTSETRSHLSSTNSMTGYGSNSPLIHQTDTEKSYHNTSSASISSLDDKRVNINSPRKGHHLDKRLISHRIPSDNQSGTADDEVDTFDDYDSTNCQIYGQLNQETTEPDKINSGKEDCLDNQSETADDEVDTFDDYDSTNHKMYKQFSQKVVQHGKMKKRIGTSSASCQAGDGHVTDQPRHNSHNELKISDNNGNLTQHHMSSENISTPNSGRSRSASILSSDYVSEEVYSGDINGNECTNRAQRKSLYDKENLKDSSDNPACSLERLCNLVHELKEEDLNSYRERISAREATSVVNTSEEKKKITDSSYVIDSNENEIFMESLPNDAKLCLKNTNDQLSLNDSIPDQNFEAPSRNAPESIRYMTDQGCGSCPKSFCLNDILVPTLPVLITPISVNMANLYQGNSGIPMRRNMEFHQDIGTAAYVSVVQDHGQDMGNDSSPVNDIPRTDMDFGNVSYANCENVNMRHEQCYASFVSDESSFSGISNHHSGFNTSPMYSLDQNGGPMSNDNPVLQTTHSQPITLKCVPSSTNTMEKNSVESVDSLVCPPVATASTGSTYLNEQYFYSF